MKTAILILAALFAAAPARAEARVSDERPVQQNFGADHTDCLGWSDGCMICTPKTCSTPGIACTPHETVCTAQGKKPPVAPPPQKP